MRRLATIWRLANLPCQEISELVSRSLDHELPRPERLAVTLHLLYCTACRGFRRELLTLKLAMARLASDPACAELAEIPHLPPEARERIKRKLRAGDAPRSD
jgi:predicted anti-sigma-YlaC factor YlaD